MENIRREAILLKTFLSRKLEQASTDSKTTIHYERLQSMQCIPFQHAVILSSQKCSSEVNKSKQCLKDTANKSLKNIKPTIISIKDAAKTSYEAVDNQFKQICNIPFSDAIVKVKGLNLQNKLTPLAKMEANKA